MSAAEPITGARPAEWHTLGILTSLVAFDDGVDDGLIDSSCHDGSHCGSNGSLLAHRRKPGNGSVNQYPPLWKKTPQKCIYWTVGGLLKCRVHFGKSWIQAMSHINVRRFSTPSCRQQIHPKKDNAYVGSVSSACRAAGDGPEITREVVLGILRSETSFCMKIISLLWFKTEQAENIYI